MSNDLISNPQKDPQPLTSLTLQSQAIADSIDRTIGLMMLEMPLDFRLQYGRTCTAAPVPTSNSSSPNPTPNTRCGHPTDPDHETSLPPTNAPTDLQIHRHPSCWICALNSVAFGPDLLCNPITQSPAQTLLLVSSSLPVLPPSDSVDVDPPTPASTPAAELPELCPAGAELERQANAREALAVGFMRKEREENESRRERRRERRDGERREE